MRSAARNARSGQHGGDQQGQGNLQVVVNILDLGANIQAAGDMARFSHNQATNTLQMESQLFRLVAPSSPRWATRCRRRTASPSVDSKRSCSLLIRTRRRAALRRRRAALSRSAVSTAEARISAKTAKLW